MSSEGRSGAGLTGTVEGLFRTVVLVQVVSFLVFILDNLNSLDNVEVTILNFDGSTSTSTINMYVLMGVLAGVFVILIIASISFLGISLSSGGVVALARYISLAIIYVLSSISLAFYLTVTGIYAVIELLIAAVYLLYVVTGYA